MTECVVSVVNDPSGVGEARRRATALVARLGFDETDVGRVALIVSEGASNLAKYGGGGEILLRTCPGRGAAAVEILFLDRGPGIPDVDVALRDGHSSAGTPGTGLGAIRRVADGFDAYSRRSGGVALLAVVRARGRSGTQAPRDVSGLSIARAGEEVCGDDWADQDLVGGGHRILVVDGLGHGPGAFEAAREARRLFEEGPSLDPGETLDRLHRGLRSTRGAAAAVAAIDPSRGRLLYAGVGNVAGTVIGGDRPRSLVSHNGILGHELRRIQEFSYPSPPGFMLVLHSDGLKTQWDLEAYPGLRRHTPALIAGILYRDFRRPHDDVTVVVARPSAT